MDEIDLITIRKLLLENSRLTYRELAESTNMSVSAIHKHIKSLVDNGIINVFIAQPSVLALKCLWVLIFGTSNAKSIDAISEELGQHESINLVSTAGGKFLYISAFLRDISELQIPAGLATLLTLTYALMVPCFSWILLKQQLKLYYLIAVIISLIGIFLIISEGSLTFLNNGSFSLIGIIILISSAIFLGLFITFTSYIQKLHNNNLDPISLFYVVLVIISLFSMFMMIITGDYIIPSQETWIWLLSLVIFSTIIAFYMYFISMKTLSANQVSFLLLLQVTVPFTIDIFLFGRNYNLWVLIGSIILFISVFLSTLFSYKSRRNNI